MPDVLVIINIGRRPPFPGTSRSPAILLAIKRFYQLIELKLCLRIVKFISMFLFNLPWLNVKLGDVLLLRKLALEWGFFL